MRLRPSSAHIWTNCPANPVMSSRMPPEVPGDPARQGTCAAWVAEMVLTGAVSSCFDLIGETHENGWLVEPDMASKIQRYVDLVRSYGGAIYTERFVALNDHIAGTPDAFAVVDATGTLHVDDLKYGYGIVEPRRNPQVGIYTGAILRSMKVTPSRVVIGIYQPNAYHPAGIHRTWETNADEVMGFVGEIEQAGQRALADNPPAISGEHCEFCPAASTCPAVAAANYRVHDATATATQRHMTPQELANELRFLRGAERMLKGRRDAVEAEAKARMSRAEHIPGWHMEQGAGQRRFTADARTVWALTGVKPTYEKMVTPLELERRGARPEIVAKLTETPRTSPRLKEVPEGHFANLFKRKDG